MTGPTSKAAPRRPARLAVAVAAMLAAGGCSLSGERQVAVAGPDASPDVARRVPAVAVKTVRPAAPAAGDDAAGSADGLPTARQVFDFHPPGSRPDAWRQPFVIDTDDGPLAADVRRTAAELRDYLAASRSAASRSATLAGSALPRRCGETDVATARPGCARGTANGPPAEGRPAAAD